MKVEITEHGANNWMLEIFTSSGEFVNQLFFKTKQAATNFAEDFEFKYSLWN